MDQKVVGGSIVNVGSVVGKVPSLKRAYAHTLSPACVPVTGHNYQSGGSCITSCLVMGGGLGGVLGFGGWLRRSIHVYTHKSM